MLSNQGESFSKEVDEAFKSLFDNTCQQLVASDFALVLCLPEDSAPINDRGQALLNWVQGFMLGFGLHQDDLTGCSGDVKEALEDFAEIAMQFGYLTLFVPALPVAGIFAIMFNISQIKVDGHKLLRYYQRPFPIQDNDIGTWKTVFYCVSKVAILTNGGLIFFTMNLEGLNEWKFVNKVWFFMFFTLGLNFLQSLVTLFIQQRKEIEEIGIQVEREAFIISKLIDKVKDDNDADEFENSLKLSQSIKVKKNEVLESNK